jgi:twitching motility protein PilT
MKKQEIDHILVKMLDYHREVSDLNFTVGKPMQVESAGELIPVELKPNFKALTPFQTECATYGRLLRHVLQFARQSAFQG